MAKLILGPCFATSPKPRRRSGWRPGALRGRGPRPPEPTFCGGGHHYALVRVEGLGPGGYAYEVRLDGERRWPAADQTSPQARSARRPRRRSTSPSAPAGSRPQEPPIRSPRTSTREAPRSTPSTSWRADGARRPSMAEAPVAARGPGLRRRGLAGNAARIRSRRDTTAAGGGGRRLRGVHWLYPRPGGSRCPLALFDGPDLDGLGRPRHERRLEHLALLEGGDGPQGLVARRAVDGFVSYWIYQHLGNLSPGRSTRTRSTREVRGTRRDRACSATAPT